MESLGAPSTLKLPLWDKASAEFCFAKSRELLTKPSAWTSYVDIEFNSHVFTNEQTRQHLIHSSEFLDNNDRKKIPYCGKKKLDHLPKNSTQGELSFHPSLHLDMPRNVKRISTSYIDRYFNQSKFLDDDDMFEYTDGTIHGHDKKQNGIVSQSNHTKYFNNSQSLMNINEPQRSKNKEFVTHIQETNSVNGSTEVVCHQEHDPTTIKATLSDEAKEVYNSLVETQIMDNARETNPLRMLRSGMPVVKSRVRGKKQPNFGNITSEIDDISELTDSRLSFDQHHIDFQYLSKMNGLPSFNQSMCLSPTHTLGRHNSLFGIENDPNHSNVDENPIPLPPRDRSKTLQPKSNLPRHQRKHPLIIPGNGVSRTLAKMAICSIGDQVDGNFSFHESNSKVITAKNTMGICTADISSNSPEEFEQRIDSELAALDSLPIGNNRVTSDLLDFSENSANSVRKDNHFMLFHCEIGDPTQLPTDEDVQMDANRNTSIPSLHELDQRNDKLCGFQVTQTPGIHPNNMHFSQDKSLQIAKILGTFHTCGNVISEPKIDRDIISDLITRPKPVLEEHKSIPTQISSNYSITERNKQISDLSRHSDHVSCEDLLEFACDGPNIHRTRGPHNGEKSDEVRIMLKVLHGHSTPETCVAALNITDWDILAAIKLERLHDLLKNENNFVSLEDCKVMLNQCSGDVVKAAALLKSVDDTASV